MAWHLAAIDMNNEKTPDTPFEAIVTGLKGRCPRCGRGSLFEGYLNPGKACCECGLDYGFIDTGDGPAVFVILVIGFVVVGLALWMEVVNSPPLWMHFALWIPLTLVLSLISLRWFKGILIVLQYRNRAREGRLDGGS